MMMLCNMKSCKSTKYMSTNLQKQTDKREHQTKSKSRTKLVELVIAADSLRMNVQRIVLLIYFAVLNDLEATINLK